MQRAPGPEWRSDKLGCDPTTGGPSNLEVTLGDKDLASLVVVGNDPFPYDSFLTPTLVLENAQLSGA